MTDKPIPGAFPSSWRKYRTPDCIAISKPIRPRATAMAEVAGLREILSASASLDVTPKSGGRVHVAGQVRARIGQTCVVTLDPIENDIDEPIDLIFAPPEQIPAAGRSGRRGRRERRRNSGSAGADQNGVIDLGRLATDALFLGDRSLSAQAGRGFRAADRGRRSRGSSVCRAQSAAGSTPSRPVAKKPKKP